MSKNRKASTTYANNHEYRARVLKRQRERYANDPELRARVLQRSRALRAADPECRVRESKRYRDRCANDPEYKERKRVRALANALNRKYGITIEQRDAMLIEQGGRCRICKTDSPGKNGWNVDHIKGTKRVRGILCWPCNLLLGNAKDNAETLDAAAEYIRSHT